MTGRIKHDMRVLDGRDNQEMGRTSSSTEQNKCLTKCLPRFYFFPSFVYHSFTGCCVINRH